MQENAKSKVANFRKSETTHDLLWKMYHNSGFTEERYGFFGYEHEESGLKAIMPQFFYKLWNGKWLDPGYSRGISVEGLQNLLGMTIDCRLKVTMVIGELTEGPDGENWFMLPGFVENWEDELRDILLTVEWNVMSDINAHGLYRADVESAVGTVKYWHETADARGAYGMQYIVLPVERFRMLKNTWIYEWRQLLTKANKILDGFDAHKAEYEEKFATKVIPLVLAENGYTYIQTDDDITIVYRNAHMDKYKCCFMYDEIGWQVCLKEYDFLAELRE